MDEWSTDVDGRPDRAFYSNSDLAAVSQTSRNRRRRQGRLSSLLMNRMNAGPSASEETEADDRGEDDDGNETEDNPRPRQRRRLHRMSEGKRQESEEEKKEQDVTAAEQDRVRQALPQASPLGGAMADSEGFGGLAALAAMMGAAGGGGGGPEPAARPQPFDAYRMDGWSDDEDETEDAFQQLNPGNAAAVNVPSYWCFFCWCSQNSKEADHNKYYRELRKFIENNWHKCEFKSLCSMAQAEYNKSLRPYIERPENRAPMRKRRFLEHFLDHEQTIRVQLEDSLRTTNCALRNLRDNMLVVDPITRQSSVDPKALKMYKDTVNLRRQIIKDLLPLRSVDDL